MKIIFSRKGFDSVAGGFASPIFPDGTLFSIPIPSKSDELTYNNLNFRYKNESISSILNDLTSRTINSGKKRQCDYTDGEFHCHYDPMPFKSEDFTGIAFGQHGKTESHLRNQGIEEGDIFLFYGWFKKVEKIDDRWQYINSTRDIHLIWSYIEVGSINKIDTPKQKAVILKKYPFLDIHPHMDISNNAANTIYLSKNHHFFDYDEKRCLTDLKVYKGRATWRLPICFNYPDAFTFVKNFQRNNSDVIISYIGYGQEFVLNLESEIVAKKDKQEVLTYIEKVLK